MQQFSADEPAPRPFEPLPGHEGEPLGGLPAYLTALIGRNQDRQQLRELLIDRGHRMVVITGSGGIGKTRLAVQVATDLLREFRDGVRFLPFASVPDNADLDATFAWYLGLRDTQERSYRESIRQYLEPSHLLLVVDNAEHLPDLTELLVFIQGTCPHVSMIVTSRSTLGLYGEVVHQLQPLTVRPAESMLPGVTPIDASKSPAVQLFRERVRAVVPDFEISEENAEDIVAICDSLGGIPLALELTAPRLATSTPAALRAELQHGFEEQPQPLALAHRLKAPMSLRDTMRLSYDMLGTDEQWVFRALSIMRGQWTIEDVLPLLTPEIDELDAISHIDSLVTRSLISSPSEPANEDVRFIINPVLRAFGRSLLIALGEEEAMADRHAARMIQLAEEAEPELTGKHQQEWLRRIDALHEDFRHAHDHLLSHDRHVDALRMSSALWRYAYTRGHYREVRQWIEASVGKVEGHEALRSRALNGVGLLANVTGDVEGTRKAHEQALQLASRIGLHQEIALARIGLADVEILSGGDTSRALRHLEIAASTYERLQDARGLAAVLTNQGNIQWTRRELDHAFTMHEEARVLYAQANDLRGVAWSDTNTGRIAAQRRRYREALPRLLSALDGYVALGDAHGLNEILEALAGVAVGLDDLETASVLAGAATRLRTVLGTPLKDPDLQEFQETLEAARKAERHAEAFERGTRLSVEEAIEIARSVTLPEWYEEADVLGGQQLASERFGITPREYQVLTLLDEGLTDHQIAERLNLSHRTVQTYTGSIAQKLGASTRVSIVRAAHQAGIMGHR